MGKLPLMWAQSLYILGCLMAEVSLSLPWSCLKLSVGGKGHLHAPSPGKPSSAQISLLVASLDASWQKIRNGWLVRFALYALQLLLWASRDQPQVSKRFFAGALPAFWRGFLSARVTH